MEFRDVVGYEGLYQVSSTGVIRNAKGQTLKPQPDRGYRRVSLFKNKGRRTFKVHQLVALAFIPNPENLPTVNHKNHKRWDNRKDNLEWATHSEQQYHSYTNPGRRRAWGNAITHAEIDEFLSAF